MIASKAARPERGPAASARVEDDDRVGVAVAGVRDDRDLHRVRRRRSPRSRPAGPAAGGSARRRPPAGSSRGPRSPGTSARRAAMNISPSSASSVTKTSFAPAAAQAASMTSISAAQAAPGASDWAISIAPALAVQAHRPVVLDRVDRRRRPSAPSSRRAASRRWRPPRRPPPATVGKVATSVDRAPWAGISRRIARVTMPRVPSLPTNSLTSDSPATSLIRLPPSRDQGAVGQHHVEAEHVVGGHPVLDAAQPAGVGGDVAADRADLVRRRVGRVPQSVLRGRGLHLGVEGPRLDHRDPGGDVDLDRPASAPG